MSRWTSGECSPFAAALQELFGGELWAIVNHSRKYPNDDDLWHCYCVIDGVAYDANGGQPIEKASDTSPEKWPIPEMDKDCDVVMEWRQVDLDWLARTHEGFDPDAFPEVREYIARHPELFAHLEE